MWLSPIIKQVNILDHYYSVEFHETQRLERAILPFLILNSSKFYSE